MRFLPKSLMGQTLLAAAVALLVAQAISAALLYRASQERRETALINAAAFQLARGLSRSPDLRGPSRGQPRDLVRDFDDRFEAGSRRDRGPRRILRQLRFGESTTNPIGDDEPRDADREEQLRQFLTDQGIDVAEVAITVRPWLKDSDWADAIARFPRLQERTRQSSGLLVAGLRRADETRWRVVRLPLPPRDRAGVGAIALQTAVLFIVLLGLLYWMLRRITGPLAELRKRTELFAVSGAADEPLIERGPLDVAGLTRAHNAMEARIAAMLSEKDVMLGAIGHDLKTPLAALRVRIESVEDDAQRAKMSETVEDITRTLDEILDLARIGKSDARPEAVELSALLISIVEEYEDRGKPVVLIEGERVVAPVHLTWLKRGLRNVINNALRYGHTAEISVARAGDRVILAINDDGPGIPPDEIAHMLEPFARGEASRNRATGGAGLGLTIARAVAEQHGGTLSLTNRDQGGLRAEFRLPL